MSGVAAFFGVDAAKWHFDTSKPGTVKFVSEGAFGTLVMKTKQAALAVFAVLGATLFGAYSVAGLILVSLASVSFYNAFSLEVAKVTAVADRGLEQQQGLHAPLSLESAEYTTG